MLRENRAIVTDVPGTTRDTLEEDVVIGNTLLHLIDTAGIHETENKVESIGIEKTKESLQKADFVIVVLDASEKLSQEDREIFSLSSGCPGVVLLNKTDLPQKLMSEEIQSFTEKEIISFSAVTGEGLEQLEEIINQQFIEQKKQNIAKKQSK